MRRGEAFGLCWTDIDVEAKAAQIVRQVVQIGWATQVRAPKSDAGIRTVMLTDEIVQQRRHAVPKTLQDPKHKAPAHSHELGPTAGAPPGT